MPRRVFLTGGAGFIGGVTARLLRTLGDEVVAVVRDPSKAGLLREIGATMVAGDLSSPEAIRSAMAGSDTVVHVAGTYRIGIPKSERPAMYEANVAVTERVLDAAMDLGISRIVDISTVNAFGNTRGRVVDEAHVRDLRDGFLSYYDETKVRAHEVAADRIARGAPVVIVMPGTTYGPRDHSAAGAQLEAAYRGRARAIVAGDVGLSCTFVDDLAAGIVTAMDRGRIGEAYVMAGENLRLTDAMAIAAQAGGRRPPRIRVHGSVVRFGARLMPNAGGLIGQPPNLSEIARSSVGVTFWASSAKAEAELGYRSRPLSDGAVAAFGRP